MRISTTKIQNAFGKYLKSVLDGKDLIITKNGKGVAKLTKYDDPEIRIVKEGAVDYHGKHYMSYDDFCKITESSSSNYELINGEIYLLASPNHVHQNIIRELNGQMYNYFSGKTCGNYTSPYDVKLFNDAECFEDDPNVVQPDILVICDMDNVDENNRYQGIPSLVVEVTSPSTRSIDLIKKLNLYMMSNIPEYWIIDPIDNFITLYGFENRMVKSVRNLKLGDNISSLNFDGLVVKTNMLV